MAIQPLVAALITVLAACLVRFLSLLHKQRKMLQGLPGPPHNYLLGSMMSMAPVVEKQPSDAAPQTLLPQLQREYNLPDYFYFDAWPLQDPVLAITDVDMLDEAVLEHNMHKHRVEEQFIQAFGGPDNILSSEGAAWKKWRSLFNPGFSHRHLMTQLLPIIEECRVFHQIMADHADRKTLFRMESATTKLTINIIGKLVLGIDLDAQRNQNELVDAFVSQTQWQYLGVQFQLSELWDIRRPMMIAYNNWKMNRYIGRELEARFAATQQGNSKRVVDLALEGYLRDKKHSTIPQSTTHKLDPEFKTAAISNMKTFIFAGHDTTSSTICYALYYLEKNPDILKTLRTEHDTAFGPGNISETLLSSPHLLDKLPYTQALIKEVLRLQPPANTARSAQPGQFLHDPKTGQNIQTQGFMLYPVTIGYHRHPKYFPRPDEFNPNRFLPGSSDYEHNNRNAWIPFLKGPRNCIGQELAMIETKIILAMLVRSFDFEACFDRVSELAGDGSGYLPPKNGVVEQFGERAYQVQRGTAKPAEGMPCMMKWRDR